MDGDPYSRMISVMRNESAGQSDAGGAAQAELGSGPARMRLGRVVGLDPLQIRVAGMNLPASAFKINERLTDGSTWMMELASENSLYAGLKGTLACPCPLDSGGGGHQVGGGSLASDSTIIREATATQLGLALALGDELLLLTEDDQRFYILMKVVSAA